MMENPGYCTGSFDGLHHPSDDDDDDMVDIAGATLDFSSTDDDPPLSAGNCMYCFKTLLVGLNVQIQIYSNHFAL